MAGPEMDADLAMSLELDGGVALWYSARASRWAAAVNIGSSVKKSIPALYFVISRNGRFAAILSLIIVSFLIIPASSFADPLEGSGRVTATLHSGFGPTPSAARGVAISTDGNTFYRLNDGSHTITKFVNEVVTTTYGTSGTSGITRTLINAPQATPRRIVRETSAAPLIYFSQGGSNTNIVSFLNLANGQFYVVAGAMTGATACPGGSRTGATIKMGNLWGMAVNSDETFLYAADFIYQVVLKIQIFPDQPTTENNGVVSTLAGTCNSASSSLPLYGSSASIGFNGPTGIDYVVSAQTGNEYLFVVEYTQCVLRRFDIAADHWEHIGGRQGACSSLDEGLTLYTDASSTHKRFANAYYLMAYDEDNVFITDASYVVAHQNVGALGWRKRRILGGGTGSGFVPGVGKKAKLTNVHGIVQKGSTDTFYVAGWSSMMYTMQIGTTQTQSLSKVIVESRTKQATSTSTVSITSSPPLTKTRTAPPSESRTVSRTASRVATLTKSAIKTVTRTITTSQSKSGVETLSRTITTPPTKTAIKTGTRTNTPPPSTTKTQVLTRTGSEVMSRSLTSASSSSKTRTKVLPPALTSTASPTTPMASTRKLSIVTSTMSVTTTWHPSPPEPTENPDPTDAKTEPPIHPEAAAIGESQSDSTLTAGEKAGIGVAATTAGLLLILGGAIGIHKYFIGAAGDREPFQDEPEMVPDEPLPSASTKNADTEGVGEAGDPAGEECTNRFLRSDFVPVPDEEDDATPQD
jgi:hypothetical protein